MVFDTELFIVEIHKRPCLWHIDTEEYANKKLKYQCWGEVGEIMFPDFGKMDERQKFKKIRELKKKWKGLRDYYKRDCSKTVTKSGPNGKKRKTVCLDLLQFLSVTIIKTPNIQTETQKHDDTSSEHEPENRSFFRQPRIEQCSTGDPDMNFLLNILPEMKSMDARQNFEFRFGVMQLIKDIKYSENTPKPGSCNQVTFNVAPSKPPAQVTEYCDILLDIKRSPSSDSVTSVDDSKSIVIRIPEDKPN